MCNCCVIVILFEELFKSSVTGEVGQGKLERGRRSGKLEVNLDQSGLVVVVVWSEEELLTTAGEEMDSVAAGSMTGRQW